MLKTLECLDWWRSKQGVISTIVERNFVLGFVFLFHSSQPSSPKARVAAKKIFHNLSMDSWTDCGKFGSSLPGASGAGCSRVLAVKGNVQGLIDG